MQYFTFILTQNLLPIFIQICIGFIIQKKFKLSIQTMSKIQIYILIPSLLFDSIYNSEIKQDVITQILLFNAIIYVFLFAMSVVISKGFRFSRDKSKAFSNSLILSNQGNYLIPLLGLVFSGSIATYAISLQLMVIMIQTFVLNTIGLYNASGGSISLKEVVKRFFSLPMVYVFLAGLFFKGMHITVWEPVTTSIHIMGNSFVTVALLTLGMQLSETKLHSLDFKILISNFVKLIVTPAFAFFMVYLLGYSGIVAKVLIISAAAPSAVNSVLWAIEFGGDAEFASQTVLTSTILSAVTMTFVIALITKFL